MRCTLTDKKLSSLKAETKRKEYWDEYLPGFGVRVSPEGRKSFFVMCRVKDKQKRVTLGHYPILTLSQARERARDKLLLASEGRLIEPEIQTVLTVAEAFSRFIEIYAKAKNKDWKGTQSRLAFFIKSHGQKDIREITRRDINMILDAVVDRGVPIQANRILSGMSRFFNWCVERDYIEIAPTFGVKKRANSFAK